MLFSLDVGSAAAEALSPSLFKNMLAPLHLVRGGERRRRDRRRMMAQAAQHLVLSPRNQALFLTPAPALQHLPHSSHCIDCGRLASTEVSKGWMKE
jgi:hypothetical protein